MEIAIRYKWLYMYSIIRTKKIKTIAALNSSARHTFREQPTPNADPAKLAQNRMAGAKNSAQLTSVLQGRLPERRRSDAVLCIEYLITASPEAFERHGGHLNDLGSGYFSDAVRWLNERHGMDNVLSATLHLDERTPHLVAYVVPLTAEGRLSARDYLGGAELMRNMQDSFHDSCGASRGLQRGLRRSKAKHEDISSFYGALSAVGAAPELSAKDYALRAVGHKTSAWYKAEELTKALSIDASIEIKRRKRTSSKQKLIEIAEINNNVKAINLCHKEESLTKREREIECREKAIERREPELAIAIAKAEGMERLVELLKSKLNPQVKLKPTRATDYSYDFEFSVP
ncbi:MobV family relaxase [Pseudomonas sp. TMP9]|uniref:MobV family relaxase n=1 Tax=Pseudomonas sp. TMP9 TaxID=3133144 RepID=UPI0030CF618D